MFARSAAGLNGGLTGGNGGAAVDPGAEQGDRARIEARSLGRHGGDIVGACDRLNEPAVRALAGHERRPGIAAESGSGDAVQTQIGTLLFRSVAGGAVLRQDGLNVACIIHRLGGGENIGQQNGRE